MNTRIVVYEQCGCVFKKPRRLPGRAVQPFDDPENEYQCIRWNFERKVYQHITQSFSTRFKEPILPIPKMLTYIEGIEWYRGMKKNNITRGKAAASLNRKLPQLTDREIQLQMTVLLLKRLSK